MYLRTTRINRGDKTYRYLRLVEKVRAHGKRKQKVLTTKLKNGLSNNTWVTRRNFARREFFASIKVGL